MFAPQIRLSQEPWKGRATEHVVLFIVLYKVALFLTETPAYGHSKSYWAVISWGNVCFDVQVVETLAVCDHSNVTELYFQFVVFGMIHQVFLLTSSSNFFDET